MKTDPKNYIANYELNNYNYGDFWAGREYEHNAELMLLQRLFSQHLPKLSEQEIIDLGGAYGRLLLVYGEKAKHVTLADYSTNELLVGLGNLVQSQLQNKVSFLALNAYKMPIKGDSVDALLSVRVMHHLKELPEFVKELSRVLAPGGTAIIEFANKNHLLALIRHMARFNLFSYLRDGVQQVTHSQNSSQGMKDGQLSIMYNFSLKYVKDAAASAGLIIKGVYPCSFLRIGLLKKLIPLSTLLKMEEYFQKFFSWLHITPSLFIVLQKPGEWRASEPLSACLVCPTCHGGVVKNEKTFELSCKKGHRFPQTKIGITDLRDPRPEEVTF